MGLTIRFVRRNCEPKTCSLDRPRTRQNAAEADAECGDRRRRSHAEHSGRFDVLRASSAGRTKMKRVMMMVVVGALLVYGAMTLQPAKPTAAQTDVRTPRLSVVTVTEEAQVTTAPDRAMIELGVVTQAPNARAAAAENATRTDKVIAAVRAAVKSGAKIETTNYSLSPNYEYPRDGGQPRLTGYTASNTVRVTTDNLREVGPVIDTAVGASANNVQNLQ